MIGISRLIESIISLVYMMTVITGLSWGATYTIKTIHDKMRVLALEKANSEHVKMEKITKALTGGTPDF